MSVTSKQVSFQLWKDRLDNGKYFLNYYHLLRSLVFLSTVPSVALQILVVILAATVWKSTFYLVFLLPIFIVEWLATAWAFWHSDKWAMDELTGGGLILWTRVQFPALLSQTDPPRYLLQWLSLTYLLFWLAMIVWLRPLMLTIEYGRMKGASSCTREKFSPEFIRVNDLTVAEVAYNPHGYFGPDTEPRWYQSGKDYMFCPMDVRWASDTSESIVGFDRNEFGELTNDPGPYIRTGDLAKPAYPNKGLGAINVYLGLPTPLAAGNFHRCPAQTTAIDTQTGQAGEGRKVCSTCLNLLRKQNEGGRNVDDGLDHCPYDPNAGTNVFCWLCPRISPLAADENLKLVGNAYEFDGGQLFWQTLWIGLAAGSSVIRDILLSITAIFVNTVSPVRNTKEN